jgi:hypothetical protein
VGEFIKIKKIINQVVPLIMQIMVQTTMPGATIATIIQFTGQQIPEENPQFPQHPGGRI